MENIKLIDLSTYRYVAKLNKGELVNHCKDCIFFDENCKDNCAMNATNSVITKAEKKALLAHCIGENRYYKCVSCVDNDITIDGDKYYLVKSLVNTHIKFSCAGCAFLNRGDCNLLIYRNQGKVSKLTYEKCGDNADNYIWIAASKVDLIKPQDIEKESVIKFNKEDMEELKDKDKYSTSSTGVVNPSTDTVLKEPSNDVPRVTKADTKRTLTFELTLKEAREYYYSHNPVLKHIACRLFTPAELEDVRRCTINVDIETAKRLYRNAEKAVRDFVLSAFNEEELKY